MITDAPAPFYGAATDLGPPDFILRSADQVDFHVHKDMLRIMSNMFAGMLSVPAESGIIVLLHRDGKVGWRLSEPAGVLQRLLTLAYPVTSPAEHTLKAADLDHIIAVLKAARFYQLLGVQKLLADLLEAPTLLDTQSHRLFAIARLCDLRSPRSSA
ncbi:hypothetical protein C8R43DRAFT_910022 [Mycena crocata]|nr:hypothetical protein C8R43DRAFT_910022 [Mycena crocata]